MNSSGSLKMIMTRRRNIILDDQIKQQKKSVEVLKPQRTSFVKKVSITKISTLNYTQINSPTMERKISLPNPSLSGLERVKSQNGFDMGEQLSRFLRKSDSSKSKKNLIFTLKKPQLLVPKQYKKKQTKSYMLIHLSNELKSLINTFKEIVHEFSQRLLLMSQQFVKSIEQKCKNIQGCLTKIQIPVKTLPKEIYFEPFPEGDEANQNKNFQRFLNLSNIIKNRGKKIKINGMNDASPRQSKTERNYSMKSQLQRSESTFKTSQIGRQFQTFNKTLHKLKRITLQGSIVKQ